MDRAKVIFGNVMPNKTYKKACNGKRKNAKKWNYDENKSYPTVIQKNPYIGDSLDVDNILVGELETNNHFNPEDTTTTEFDTDKGVIVGNIRMGFGHYRISMAMASCAKALGYKPYWMDLNSYKETPCTKIIAASNELYSLGSRWSKNPIFNKLVWEPVNYETFRQLSYNCADLKNAEIMAQVYKNVPKDIPVIGTHAWPAQAAVSAGMKHVVNAIPDNWPMALHFSEGAVHAIQCKNAYMGYRICNGMQKEKVCNPMPNDSLVYTGHYIDHELVSNIESDCDARMARKANGKATRYLLTIGGAGAQRELFAPIIKHLMPEIKEGKAVVYLNIGDYNEVWDWMKNEIQGIADVATEHMDNWSETEKFCESALDPNTDVQGVHVFWHKNIFEAVYATNLLMRSSDVLVTKPSELAFYPIPKLFIRRVGKHEMWGAIHSAEVGDGTLECRDVPHILQMVDMFQKDDHLLGEMCESIKENKKVGLYDGAYKVVEIAMGLKNK